MNCECFASFFFFDKMRSFDWIRMGMNDMYMYMIMMYALRYVVCNITVSILIRILGELSQTSVDGYSFEQNCKSTEHVTTLHNNILFAFKNTIIIVDAFALFYIYIHICTFIIMYSHSEYWVLILSIEEIRFIHEHIFMYSTAMYYDQSVSEYWKKKHNNNKKKKIILTIAHCMFNMGRFNPKFKL